MASIELGNVTVERPGKRVYIIAEIGQNHQGDIGIAKQMILEAKKAGCDCVKFQKSCLDAKFTKSALCRCYNGHNSWGTTYGEHKEFLELTLEHYIELKSFCRSIQIDFTASAMDKISLQHLDQLDVPFIKIGSGDANNMPMLEEAAKLKRPLVISTGMQSMKTIELIVEIMKKANKNNYALLHCVSAYPTEPKDCSLQMIQILSEKYPHLVIGYSGHEIGVDITKAAVLLGARIIERHITLDKTQKGSDHKCSLEPIELQKMVQEVKLLLDMPTFTGFPWTRHEILTYFSNDVSVHQALAEIKEKRIFECEINCKNKLGKSIVAARDLKRGQILQCNDICIKVSEPNGIPAEYYFEILGLELDSDVENDAPLKQSYFSNHISI